MNTAKEYWLVHIEHSQMEIVMNTVLVDAPTREEAEAIIRNNGCTARYITVLRNKVKVVN
jgi:hypothetical protein